MDTKHTPVFNEDSLRQEIATKWGSFGAHAEVYSMLLRDRNALAARVKELEEAASEAQCECSMRERDSGHRVGCWFPNLQAALSKARS